MDAFVTSPYVYKSPLENGYEQVSLAKKALAKAGVRQRYRFNGGYSACFFHSERGFYIEHLPRMWAKALLITSFPFVVLLCGPLNVRKLFRELRRELRPRHYGAFVSDEIWPGSRGYQVLYDELHQAVRA